MRYIFVSDMLLEGFYIFLSYSLGIRILTSGTYEGVQKGFNYSLCFGVYGLHRILKDKKKCKAIPLQAWIGPEASVRLRLPDFKTVGT